MLTKSLSLLICSAFSVNSLSNTSKHRQIYSETSKSESILYAWGNGIYGQLGLGAEKISQSTPENIQSLNTIKINKIFASYDSSSALTDDNTLYVWGKTKDGSIGLFPGGVSNNVLVPTVFPFSHQIQGKITQVSLSKEHSGLVNDLGHLYTWGKDSFGCLGHGLKENKKRGGLNINIVVCDRAQTGEISNVEIKQVSCGYNFTVK